MSHASRIAISIAVINLLTTYLYANYPGPNTWALMRALQCTATLALIQQGFYLYRHFYKRNKKK